MLALMPLTAARRADRTDGDGELGRLDEQDRARLLELAGDRDAARAPTKRPPPARSAARNSGTCESARPGSCHEPAMAGREPGPGASRFTPPPGRLIH
ncbi:hypothetical protein [Streptomyces kunmingensis]|uniref:hypothetical protein n=1 Tax=Streptomyces kunmingensis TaxID=68225 RepID=UPI003982FF86